MSLRKQYTDINSVKADGTNKLENNGGILSDAAVILLIVHGIDKCRFTPDRKLPPTSGLKFKQHRQNCLHGSDRLPQTDGSWMNFENAMPMLSASAAAVSTRSLHE